MTASDPGDFGRRAHSFDSAADTYERARPSYPGPAVDWLLDGVDGPVLDLGAGTGKLTRSVVARGLPTTAVDPGPAMLEQLSAALPQVPTLVGTAEDLPLPDDSMAALVAGQAWHWVDESRALPEVRRVLRPGGRIGLIWNIRDESVAWVAELSTAMGSSEAENYVLSALSGGRGPLAGLDPDHEQWSWSRPMTADGLVDLALSRSYLITATAERRESTVAAVRDLVERHFGADPFELPYRTHVFRVDLP